MEIGRGLLALVALWAAVVSPAKADCTLVKLFELPVTIAQHRILVPAKLNGIDLVFMLDTGAQLSTLSLASVAKLGLTARTFEGEITLSGIGGTTGVIATTRAKTLSFAGRTIKDPEFSVSEDGSTDWAGVLGHNMFANVDIEFDLAHSVVRAMRPVGCGASPLAYWAGGGSQDYSVIDIDSNSYTRPDPTVAEYGDITMPHPHTAGHATLNGVKVKVLFDTGSQQSLVSLAAAAIAGVKTSDTHVTPVGYISGVAKQSATKAWIGEFSDFKLGDEDIKNARILMTSDDRGINFDMIAGLDFFMSHHIYISNLQHKLYFRCSGLRQRPPRRARLQKGLRYNIDAGYAAGPDGARDDPEILKRLIAAEFAIKRLSGSRLWREGQWK